MEIQTIYDKLWEWCERGNGRSFSISVHPNHMNKHTTFLHLPGKKHTILCDNKKQLERLLTIL